MEIEKWCNYLFKDEGKIIGRDTFKVERKIIGNFPQEVMQPIVTTETNSFTRISYLNCNRTNLRSEYSVFDTKYPIMMAETSSNHQLTGDSITLYLDAFFALLTVIGNVVKVNAAPLKTEKNTCYTNRKHGGKK